MKGYMKKLLFCLLITSNLNSMSDSPCGAISSSDWNSPNDHIAKLNGADFIKPKKYSYKLEELLDSIKTFIDDLYVDELVDLEVMLYELESLKNKTNTDMLQKIIDHIKNLKGE